MEEVSEQDMKWYLAEVLPEVVREFENLVSAYALARAPVGAGMGGER